MARGLPRTARGRSAREEEAVNLCAWSTQDGAQTPGVTGAYDARPGTGRIEVLEDPRAFTAMAGECSQESGRPRAKGRAATCTGRSHSVTPSTELQHVSDVRPRADM